jgi:hypothetical protein
MCLPYVIVSTNQWYIEGYMVGETGEMKMYWESQLHVALYHRKQTNHKSLKRTIHEHCIAQGTYSREYAATSVLQQIHFV